MQSVSAVANNELALGYWVLSAAMIAEQERHRANQLEQQLEDLRSKLRQRGIDPDSL